jgi:acetoacetyl-CoA synthetase
MITGPFSMNANDNNDILWIPNDDAISHANISHYKSWVNETYQLNIQDYTELWKWSTDDVSIFWDSIMQYFKVDAHGSPVPTQLGQHMPDITWYPDLSLNYVAHIFRNKQADAVAIKYASEFQPLASITWAELKIKVIAFREYLEKCGVVRGDRVAAYIPNIPEAIIGFLATASLGAVWSSCSPDFGVDSVIERMAQIEPKVFLCASGYSYNGKYHSRIQQAESICAQIPSIKYAVCVPFLNAVEYPLPASTDQVSWISCADVLTLQGTDQNLVFDSVLFGHPLYILYSSGTTGAPKAITHGHGGILLEHLKYLSFHNDVKPGETFFWYSTTGWMMWNYALSALLLDATLLLYEGSASYPDLNAMWSLVDKAKVSHFGTSAAFLTACMKAKLNPGGLNNLKNLRSIGSTGSPLPPEGFDWIYQQVKPDIWLCSMSGGTDVCTAFVGGNPQLPVKRGEIQCRALGCALYAWDDEGNSVEDEVGEMVVVKPMPSMPVFFWADPAKSKYKASYFEDFPGVWRHGDWVKITPSGSLVIYGRSDATLNRQGVRIGTSEIYRALDQLPEVADALIVNLELPDGSHYMPLFVQLADKQELSGELCSKINGTLRSMYSPRHVPDQIFLVDEIPYTISGKKMEAPVKKILLGRAPEKSYNEGAMRNPSAMDYFKSFQLPG